MADKPSRAVVIYGEGLASAVTASHSHLHSFASLATCGFLSLRDSIPDEAVDETRVKELAQLLDAYDSYVAMNKEHGADIDPNQLSNPILSERFMGLRAAFFTACSSFSSFAGKIGFNAMQINEFMKSTDSGDEVPAESSAVYSLLQLLGISGDEILEKSEYDLVLLHIKNDDKIGDGKGIDWLNKFVGDLMQTTQPGSKVSSRLHVSIVLSYGTVIKSEEKCSLVEKSSNSDLSLLRPRQSYTMKGGNTLTEIRHHHPMLVAQWQEGVTRRDTTTSFAFDEFKENGCNRAILADRFLHELAFKLWKAPKYGA